jgi:hypothetical protein
MNQKRHTLSTDDVRQLKQIVRKVNGGRTSQRPLPTRRRNRSSGAGGGLRWGQATTAITAATAWGTYGSGTVQPKDADGADDGDPITVDNWFWDAFDDNSVVCYDPSYDPPRVVSVGCTVST